MATRLYYDPVAIPTISPTFDAAVWDQTTAAVRRLLTTRTVPNGTAEITFADLEVSATNNFDVLLVQAISPPLAAQTISGAISGQIRASETNALAQDFPRINIRAFDSSGTTSRGTLIDLAGATEHTLTTLTNAKYPISTVPTSTDVSNGDVLVVEVGWRSVDTAITSWGSTLSIGRSAATDLPVNETDTTAINPWIEFADDLLFMQDPSGYVWRPDGAFFQTASATGTASASLTFTLPAVVGKRHAISQIQVLRSTNAAIAGATAPLLITTHNLRGMAWAVGNIMVAGQRKTEVYMEWPDNPLLSDAQGTPTIIACPAGGTASIWTVNVSYALVP